jgi:hypothetical protein
VGFIWVTVWLGPWNNHSEILPTDAIKHVPYSVVGRIGVPAGGYTIVLGGLMLNIIFGANF